MKWSIYTEATGRLLGRTLTASYIAAASPAMYAMDGTELVPAKNPAADFIAANLQAGESAIDGDLDHELYYVVDGAAVARDPCPITSSVASLVVTLAGVPLGATVVISGTATDSIINDDASGDLEITLPSAGPYYITADCWPAIDYAEHFTP